MTSGYSDATRPILSPLRAAQPRALTPAQTVMADAMSEATLLQLVLDLADVHRLCAHHETDSRKSRRGLPDIFAVGPGGFLAVELKSQKGRIRPEQLDWIGRLAGIEARLGSDLFRVRLWRPSDWFDGGIEATLRDLARPFKETT